MTDKKLFIFDLDGTLIDSLEDIKNSVNYAFRTMNIKEKSTDEVRRAIGNGALRLIEELIPECELFRKEEAYNYYISHYNEHCSEETIVYDGVREYLQLLYQIPTVQIALLTNKPEESTKIILARLGLDIYFDLVIGGDTLPLRKPDPSGILYSMKHFSVTPSQTIMIGDSLPDIKAAHAAGVRSVGLVGGFGDGHFVPDISVRTFVEMTELSLHDR